MPISLNPLHYVLAGLIVLLLGISTYAYITKTQLRAVEAEHAAFVETQKALGEIAARNAAETEARNIKIKQEANDAYNKLIADNRDLANRLRDDRSRSRTVSLATTFAGQSTATIDQAGLSEALQQFDERVSEIVRECDQTSVEINNAREWAEKAWR